MCIVYDQLLLTIICLFINKVFVLMRVRMCELTVMAPPSTLSVLYKNQKKTILSPNFKFITFLLVVQCEFMMQITYNS